MITQNNGAGIMKKMRSRASWRAEQLREFALHLETVEGSLRDINPADRREIEKRTGMRFIDARRRVHTFCIAARELESEMRAAASVNGKPHKSRKA
jgi:hypothetical protein